MQRINKKPTSITLTKLEQDNSNLERDQMARNKSGLQSIQNLSEREDSQIDSPTRRKKNAFITQKKTSEVDQAHNDLNNYIDVIEVKVSRLIEKHEAQFLVAYRNHVKRVREEMEEIRSKANSNADSSVTHTEKIQSLEKQLSIFREESLKLFEKVNEKQKTIYYLQKRVDDLQVENQSLSSNIRNLTKRNKHLEANSSQLFLEKEKSSVKEFQVYRPNYGDDKMGSTLSNYNFVPINNKKNRPYTTAINSKATSIRTRNQSMGLNGNSKFLHNEQVTRLFKKMDEMLVDVDEVTLQQLKFEIHKIFQPLQQNQESLIKNKSNGMGASFLTKRIEVRDKQTKTFIESKVKAKKSQLEEYFSQSIETVRKEITRRRGLKSLNFYKEHSALNLQEFKKVDFFRILEILMSHEKIIEAVHKAIFHEQQKYQ